MPINPKLKEQLEKTQMDEKYRANLIATLEDAPADVQNLWMSREDYTRQANALKAEKADWDVKNKDFYDKSNAAVTAWKDEVKKANDAVTAAQARIAELEAAGGSGRGGERTPAEEDAVSKEIAKLSAGITGLQERLKSVVTPDELNKKWQDGIGFIGDQILTINEIQASHIEKFGKRMTKAEITELIKFTNDQAALGKNLDLSEAYTAKNADELKKLERAQWEKEWAEKHNTNQNVPGGGGPGGPGAPGRGPLELRLEQERNRTSGGTGDKGYATWQEAAAAAGQELVNEGKF
jgi:hypothetical protein